MRKVFLCLLAGLCFFSACSEKKLYMDPSNISPSFSCEAFIKKGEEEYTVQLFRNEERGFFVCLDDHAFIWSGGKYYEQYAGLEFECTSSILQKDALPQILKDLFDSVYSDETIPEDEKTMSGVCRKQPFTAEVDLTTGFLKRILWDDLDLKILLYYK